MDRVPLRVLLGRTVFHPAAAALYLAALVLSIPVYRAFVHLPDVEHRARKMEETVRDLRGWGGAVELTVLSGATRGGPDVPAVQVGDGQPVVPLAAELELPREDLEGASFGFSIVGATGNVVWSRSLAGEVVARSMNRVGLITLLVPSSDLPPTRYRLVVTRTEGTEGGPLLDAPFDVALSQN